MCQRIGVGIATYWCWCRRNVVVLVLKQRYDVDHASFVIEWRFEQDQTEVTLRVEALSVRGE